MDMPAVRGFLTRWLLEISPGVFIGGPSAPVRVTLWEGVQRYAGMGRALLAYNTDNEQGFAFETHDHKWRPIDQEGVTLIHRPSDRVAPPPPSRQGWSKASKRRRFGSR
ncbi:type I-E CRISPR-associated endoribonuclease Cas2e [Streptomyces goshikiensis]|uniref:type I-E CRISPR-associated endoribonuclease Cas2e n=1 Tax=Streptomyces goshikiensis TaxID=1942 RepID=UPI00367979AC